MESKTILTASNTIIYIENPIKPTRTHEWLAQLEDTVFNMLPMNECKKK